MKKLLSILIFSLCAVSSGWSQEFLLHDETFTWTKDADECGGFHYWYDWGQSPRMNWMTPDDYKDGLFYFRFEIIDQPTNKPFQLNFCIWTEFTTSPAVFWRESCATFSDVLAGPGSISTFSSTVLPAWNGGIDWTNLAKLWRFGNPLWINKMNLGNGPNCTDHPELWADVDSYLPLKLRVTIVAVPAGQTFSGWSNYISGGTQTKKPTPNYSIDYTFERTNNVVPATDEYSGSADMSGAVSGSGSKLTLTPGQDVYFRTKAGDGLLASDIQHLTVPARPSLTYTGAGTITADLFTVQAVLAGGMTGFDLSHVSVTNGVAQNLRSGTTFDVVPTAAGNVNVVIPVNAFNGASFASNTITVNYNPGACTPAQQATPTYGIDYSAEKTDKVVPATDEYSYNSDMSAAVSGTGQKLTIIPGQDVYFRTKKVSDCLLASGIQHLVVPARPAVPSVSIDFINERTVENIGSTLQYSTSSSYANPVTGNGSKVTLTPGQDLYFWVNVTASSFYSLVTHLTVPARPTLTYTGAGTITADLFTVQAVLAGGMTGFDLSHVSVTNGVAQNLHSGTTFDVVPTAAGNVNVVIPVNAFNGASFASNTITVNYNPGACTPTQQATPTYGIDYASEKTDKAVLTTDEYSYNGDMSAAVSGTGQKLTIIPGQDVYFRTKKVSDCLLASGIQHLVIPARPAAPSVTVDFANETTVENIGSTIQYSTSSSYTNPVNGAGTRLALTPGQDLYFWINVTSNSFYSLVTHLVVPNRPDAPVYSIDFVNERTSEAVPAETEYSTSADMTGSQSGTATYLALMPGSDYYFRVKNTASSFASPVFHLAIIERPVINTTTGDTLQGDSFTATIDFHTDATGFTSAGVTATNAGVTLLGDQTIKLVPLAAGEVTLKVNANAISAGNFVSETFKTYYKGLVSSVPGVSDVKGSLLLYPSPAGDVLHIVTTRNFALPVDIRLVNNNGATVQQQKLYVVDSELNLKNIPPGLYIVKAIDSKGNVFSEKIVKQ